MTNRVRIRRTINELKPFLVLRASSAFAMSDEPNEFPAPVTGSILVTIAGHSERVPVTVDMPHSATTGGTTRETHLAAILAALEKITPGNALHIVARDSVTNTYHWEVSL